VPPHGYTEGWVTRGPYSDLEKAAYVIVADPLHWVGGRLRRDSGPVEDGLWLKPSFFKGYREGLHVGSNSGG
jgi:hypothetical protein